MIELYEIATHAAKSGAKRGCYSICSQDMDDMIQEAALAILESKKGHGRAYYFVAGRRWSEAWLKWWKYGAGADKLRGLIDNIDPLISLFSLGRNENFKPAFNEDKPTEMQDGQIDQLKEIFYKIRKRHHANIDRAVWRDIAICKGLYAKESTEAIGLEIGTNAHMINRYRHDIRKRLTEYLESKNL